MNETGEHQMSWEEWTQELYDDSFGEIDLTELSEKSAQTSRPQLYYLYQSGLEPSDYISHYRRSYEGGDVVFWIDPDDDEELGAILSNTKFYETFSSEISNLAELNDITNINNKVLNTLKKQIFVSAITCLETYLSDAFINTILSDKEYIKSFFPHTKILKIRA